jgi:hypothetical protein
VRTSYNDLGNGTVYGSLTVSNADDDSFLLINLTAGALAGINAAQGGQFVLGGPLTTLTEGETEEVLYAFSSLPFNDPPNHSQLLLAQAGVGVPEPGTLTLVCLGCLAFGRRRK